jgi:hypothetical protein
MELQLIFKRFNQYAIFYIDRENKKLRVNGEPTNYKEQVYPWRMLWDKCFEHSKQAGIAIAKNRPVPSTWKCRECIAVAKRQEIQTQDMNNEDFVKVFEDNLKFYGYKLAKWQFN